MRQQLLFGTGGVPLSAKSPTTESGIERIAELDLGCMEVQFVRGVKMSDLIARRAADIARSKGVKLSAHAPYFINLSADDTETAAASKHRLVQTARIASALGAEAVVFHAGYYLSTPPPTAFAIVRQALEEIWNLLSAEGNQVLLRPETTGKRGQFGTVEEVLSLSVELEGIAPCIDFAHLHARTGKLNSYREFAALLEQIEERLGRQAIDQMHIHVTGVQYGEHGEIRHTNLKESDFNYVDLLRALKEVDAGGLVICESPNLESDALLLQRIYSGL